MLRRCTCWLAGARALVRAATFAELESQIGPSDTVVYEWRGGAAEYQACPGASPEELCANILARPIASRQMHAIFGRDQIPVDVVVDVDTAPLTFGPDGGAPADMETLRTLVVNALLDSIDRRAAMDDLKVAQRVVLQSASPDKLSLHCHARFEDAAFASYADLRAFMADVTDGINVPGATPEFDAAVRSAIDQQIYRKLGSVRMYSAPNRQGLYPVHLVPGTDKVPARKHWHVGPTDPMTLGILSLVQRDPLEVDRLVQLEVKTTAPAADGVKLVSAHGACEAARDLVAALPLRDAVGYNGWATTGMCLRRIEIDLRENQKLDGSEELRLLWHEFSKRCPEKYDERECERAWGKWLRQLCKSTDPSAISYKQGLNGLRRKVANAQQRG